MFLESRQGPAAGAIRRVGGGVVAEPVEFALSRRARRRGLLGRDGLAPGSGMLLAPCSSIHTWFMRFPIDVIFLARNGTVVKLCRHVTPWRLAFGFGAYATLELPSGAIDRAGVSVGERLELA